MSSNPRTSENDHGAAGGSIRSRSQLAPRIQAMRDHFESPSQGDKPLTSGRGRASNQLDVGSSSSASPDVSSGSLETLQGDSTSANDAEYNLAKLSDKYELEDKMPDKVDPHSAKYLPQSSDTALQGTCEAIPDPHSESDRCNLASQAGTAKGYSASKIFSSQALPLHLPNLDHFLDTDPKFQPPKFTDPKSVCSKAEAILYGYHGNTKFRSSRLEAAGSQLLLPREKPSDSLRQRKWTWHRKSDRIAECDWDEQKSMSTSHLETGQGEISNAGLEQQDSAKVPVASQPTANGMFPPLMLFRNHSLNELKSNAVGPRKPPGGFLSYIPGAQTLLGIIVDFIIGLEGSTFAIQIFRLQLFVTFVQMMSLSTSYATGTRSSDEGPMFAKLQAIFALNYVSAFGNAIIILMTFIIIVLILLLQFWRLTRMYDPNRTLEGYASQTWRFRLMPRFFRKHTSKVVQQPHKSTVWSKVGYVTLMLLLTILYIPLSKLCMDVVVWGIDYWPDVTDKRMAVALEVGQTTTRYCYRTNVDSSDFNWAYVIVPLAALTLLAYTLWFPWQLRRMILRFLPRLEPFNELGHKRSPQIMDLEYSRALHRDKGPFNFLYNAYRRKYGDYKPLYMLVFKLSSLLAVSIITQQNCLFQHHSIQKMLTIRQSFLIFLDVCLLAAVFMTQPFIDRLSNRSELVSRIGYCASAILGLGVALGGEVHKPLYQSILLYTVFGLTYGLNFYFTFVATPWTMHLIKRIQRRFDFSIDLFSPFLDLDKHFKRRIWQETLSTILLSGTQYRMPIGQDVTFMIDDRWPPYLLNFKGSAAERHVENLKILKDVGLAEFNRNVGLLNNTDDASLHFRALIKRIQLEFVGPDAFWEPVYVGRSRQEDTMEGVSTYFGKAFMIPFPPTLVIRYDQTRKGLLSRSTIQLRTVAEFEEFVRQNESDDIRSRRWIRQTLRALDGQQVFCPYVGYASKAEKQPFLQRLTLQNLAGGYQALEKPIQYSTGTLHIKRQHTNGLSGKIDGDAGFEITIKYEYGRRQGADGVSNIKRPLTITAATAFGLRNDFAYTPSVQQFIDTNSNTIRIRMPQIQRMIDENRIKLFEEARKKREKLSYAFLTDVFESPVYTIGEVEERFLGLSACQEVQLLPHLYPATIRLLIERMRHVHQTRIHMWWYLLWDDLWRQNSGDYSALRKHATLFNPKYPSSIAYTPMSRARLVALLQSKSGVWKDRNGHSKSRLFLYKFRNRSLFDDGIVNRIYFLLDAIMFSKDLSLSDEDFSSSETTAGDEIYAGFSDTNGSIIPHALSEIDPAKDCDPFDQECNEAPGSRFTGGGTNENDTTIIDRDAWNWTEQRLGRRHVHTFAFMLKERVLEWLEIRPYRYNRHIKPLRLFLRRNGNHYDVAMPPRAGALPQSQCGIEMQGVSPSPSLS